MSLKWVPVGISGNSPLMGIIVCTNSGVRSHLGTRDTGKGSWSFQCWVPHSIVASILATNFWAFSPNADRHLTASWSGAREWQMAMVHAFGCNSGCASPPPPSVWGTPTVHLRVPTARRAAQSGCVVLLGDWPDPFSLCWDGQTPGFHASCLLCTPPSSHPQLLDRFLLLLRRRLLLRFRLLLRALWSSCCLSSSLTLEHPWSWLLRSSAWAHPPLRASWGSGWGGILAHLRCSALSGEGCGLANVWSWHRLALAVQVPNTCKGQLYGGYWLHWDLAGCPGSSHLIQRFTQVGQLVAEWLFLLAKVRRLPWWYGGGTPSGSLPLHHPFCQFGILLIDVEYRVIRVIVVLLLLQLGSCSRRERLMHSYL